MRSTFALSMILIAVAVTGCGWRKQHLTQSYGQSYDSAFAVQRERVGKPPAEAAAGLDAQEAAIIADAYRRSLAPKGGSARQEPIILMAPATSNQPVLPPPSVPKS